MAVNININNSGVEDFSELKEKLYLIKKSSLPSFVLHKPDIEEIKSSCAKYKSYENYIIIGNGGSVNSSLAFYESIGREHGKNFVFLTTMEPDYINFLKKKYDKKTTLVIPVSKSGTTVGVLESFFSFLNSGYDILAMTQDTDGALMKIIKKKGLAWVMHPDVGGRFSGRSSCALLPAELMGLDISEIEKGFLSAYKKCAPDVDISENPALCLASVLYLLEKKGFYEVFVPVYSKSLSGFLQLIVQLMHESFCKKEKGQTYFGGEAPETQHHTNQRFFGGRKNVCGLFIKAERQSDCETRANVPDDLKDIILRGGTLADISKTPYEKALEFEFMGTWQDAADKKIPSCLLLVDRVSDFTAGEFMGFLQYAAVYGSLIRGVNPYDQPQVEDSKEISFRLRKEYKK